MEINKQLLSLGALDAAIRSRAIGESETPLSESANNESPSSDNANILQERSLVSRALQADGAGREERIAELQAAVQGGTYFVDSKALARSLVNEMLGGRT